MEITFDKVKQVVRLSSDPSIVFQMIDGKMKLLYYSSGFAALYGYNEDEFAYFKTQDFLKYFNEYEKKDIYTSIMGITNNDTVYNFDLMVHNKSQQLVSVKGNSIYLGEYGKCPTFIAVLNSESGRMTNENLSYLLKSERRYNTVLNFAGIYVWDYDLKDKTIKNDNGWIQTFGYTTEFENFPQSFVDLKIVDKESAEEFLECFAKLNSGQREVTHESWYHLNGFSNPICLRVSYTMEFNDSGIPVIAHAYAMNITDIKNSESMFHQRTKAYLRMNPNALITMQANISQNSCSIVGLEQNNSIKIDTTGTLDNLISSMISNIKDKNEQIRFINSFSRGNLISSYNSGIYQVSLEHHIALYDEVEYVQTWVRTIFDMVINPVTGDIETVIHIININRRKIIDLLMREIVNSSYDFIAIENSEKDSFFYVENNNNNDFNEIKNFDEFFTNKYNNIITNQISRDIFFRQFSLDIIKKRLIHEKSFTIEFFTDEENENSERKQIFIQRVNEAEKSVFVISQRDITELYKAELEHSKELTQALYEAREANKAKSQFLSSVSHDIRTPLNGIIGMTDLALNEDISDNVRDYLTKARTSSDFLMGLINDVLDISKIESGKLTLNPDYYLYKDFEDYINAVIVPLSKKKKIEFTYNIIGEHYPIFVDKQRFNQILFNLLSNAVKYTNEGGKVNLEVTHTMLDDKMMKAQFIVTDNGIGMTEEFKKTLFDEFVQENRYDITANNGFGLGLSIVKRIIDMMGGEIFVESKVNEGSKFTVLLKYPYKKVEDTNDEIQEEIIPDLTGINILLCEDNEINQEIAASIFRNMGANVDVANNGEIGLDLFKKSEINYYTFIFMDVRMPIMNGLVTTTHIRNSRRKDSDIPIFAMTANALSEDRDDCIKSGMTEFISKPINVNVLYRVLNKYL